MHYTSAITTKFAAITTIVPMQSIAKIDPVNIIFAQ